MRQRFESRGRSLDDDDGGLPLEKSPATEISSVNVDGAPLAADGYELSDRSLYLLDGGRRRRWRASYVVVEYVCGFALPGEGRDDPAPPVPVTVEADVIARVKRHVHAYGPDPMVISESTDGVGSTTYISSSDAPRAGGASGSEATTDDDDGSEDGGNGDGGVEDGE